MLLTQVGHREDMAPRTFYLDEKESILYIWPANWAGPDHGDRKAEENAIASGIIGKKGGKSWPFKTRPVDVSKRTVEVTTRRFVLESGGRKKQIAYVNIEGFVFRYAGCWPQHSMIALRGEDLKIEDCIMEWSAARGLTIGGKRIVVRRCSLRSNGQMGLGGGGEDLLIEDCDVLYNNYKHSRFGFSENGGSKICRAQRGVVRRCRFIGNDGPGIWFDIDNYDCIIEQNYVEGNENGIMYEISYDGIIRNNICVNNGWAQGRDVVMTTLQDYEPGGVGQGILIQMSSGCKVYNNTCVGNRKTGIELRFHPYGNEEWKSKYHLRNNEVFNNILVDNGRDNLIITEKPALEPEQVEGNISDYNLYHDSRSLKETYKGNLPRYSRWGKTFLSGNYSLEEWRVIKGGDFHSIQWDPFFMMPAQKDFRFTKQSPCIGAGKVFEDLKDDFFGRPRPAGKAPSMGAIEYDPEDELTRSVIPCVCPSCKN
jgi:parallel beta-helix repeat protein